ncbi:MAG: FAD-dependent oxidoreductase, partial [Proteobacteria bacterium]|nr:FAD-dependent oxidoreductase [Pseudomonadota bacterium]
MRDRTVRSEQRLVLVGGGHAHAGVLLALGMKPETGLEVTVIAKELDAPYSGMLPGYVAGHYSLEECHIDLVKLAHFAGARLIQGEAIGIDTVNRRVTIVGRPPISYNLLSLDTGITPSVGDISGALAHAIMVKPVSLFAPKWQALLDDALKRHGPRQITVVGAGAAGLELVLAARHRLRQAARHHGISPDDFSFRLIGSGDLLATHTSRARTLARRALLEASVELVENAAVATVGATSLTTADGRSFPSDATLVATKAAPPTWFAGTGLELDDKGFVAVRSTLQALGHDDIFAVGDCAAVLDHPREKAGVFAVRQAAPLTRNLRLRARGKAAEPFIPQRHFLTLISLGDERAIAARNGFAAAGGWAWRWKDHIDRKFMAMFHRLPSMGTVSASRDPAAAAEMLCMGCAAKLGPAPLARALSRLETTLASPALSSNVSNLSPRDDAAVLDLGGNSLRLES